MTQPELDPAPPNPPAPPPRRRRLPFIILGILVLGFAAWGLQRYLYSRHHVSTDNAQIDGHITYIAPRVAAFVSRVLVDDNQPVQAGDTLVLLDNRDLKVKLDEAEAGLHEAEAAVGSRARAGQALAQLQATRSEAASALAAVAVAEADYHKAAADVERYRTLAPRKVVSAQQLDAAEAAYQGAAANLEAARRRAAAAGSQVSASWASVREADARLAAAQAEVDNARLQVSYATITAPTAGTIAKRTAETGALVQVGQNLMSIVPDRDVWVTANLKETQLTNVRVGDPVEFEVDAYPGRQFSGSVESLSPATGARFALLPPDNATGNFTKVVQRVPVKIAIEEAQDAPPLRPGMSVDVTIETGNQRESRAVARQSSQPQMNADKAR